MRVVCAVTACPGARARSSQLTVCADKMQPEVCSAGWPGQAALVARSLVGTPCMHAFALQVKVL